MVSIQGQCGPSGFDVAAVGPDISTARVGSAREIIPVRLLRVLLSDLSQTPLSPPPAESPLLVLTSLAHQERSAQAEVSTGSKRLWLNKWGEKLERKGVRYTV